MSAISDRVIRGEHLTKLECLEHGEEIARLFGAYGPAMRAMEAYERLMEQCTCSFDLNWHDAVVRQQHPDCPVHVACKQCRGSGVEADENGVQRDDVCEHCCGEGTEPEAA